MKEAYQAVLRKHKLADAFLRYCLTLDAGFEPSEVLQKKAMGAFREVRDDYMASLGDLVPIQLREKVQAESYAANKNKTSAADWGAFMRRLKAHQEQDTRGLMTGMKALDDALDGVRDVTILAGLPGAGKTTLAMNISRGVLRNHKDVGVVVFSLAMPKDEYYSKLLSLESGVPYRTLKRKEGWTKEVEDAVKKAEERLHADVLPRLRVIDNLTNTNAGERTAYLMTKTIVEFMEEAGIGKILLIVDRIQNLEVENPVIGQHDDDTPIRQRLTELEAEDAKMMLLMRLRQWSREQVPGGFPILGLSRVNKIDRGKRLALADVPGRSELLSEANCVLLLEPSQEGQTTADVAPTLLYVAKVGDGGKKGDIHLDFHHAVSKFEERRQDVRGSVSTSQQDQQEGQRKTKRFAGK